MQSKSNDSRIPQLRWMWRWLWRMVVVMTSLLCFFLLLCTPSGSFRPQLAKYMFNKLSTAEDTWQRKKDVGQSSPQAPSGDSSKTQAEMPEHSKALLHHVATSCANYNVSRPINGYMMSHMHFDDKRKVIYCFTPKVACTSWKRVWMKITGMVAPNKPFNDIDRTHVHSAIPLMNYNEENLKKLLTYKKFMFVRHPFSRVLSAFKDKLESEDPASVYNFHKEIGRKIQKKYRKNYKGQGHNTTFEEFMRFISEPGIGTDEQRNEHWVSVHDLCNPCGIKYDFIGKYETLKEDAEYVLQWLGLKDIIPKFPASERAFYANHDKSYFSQLNTSTKMAFYRKYLDDFIIFDYKFI